VSSQPLKTTILGDRPTIPQIFASPFLTHPRPPASLPLSSRISEPILLPALTAPAQSSSTTAVPDENGSIPRSAAPSLKAGMQPRPPRAGLSELNTNALLPTASAPAKKLAPTPSPVAVVMAAKAAQPEPVLRSFEPAAVAPKAELLERSAPTIELPSAAVEPAPAATPDLLAQPLPPRPSRRVGLSELNNNVPAPAAERSPKKSVLAAVPPTAVLEPASGPIAAPVVEPASAPAPRADTPPSLAVQLPAHKVVPAPASASAPRSAAPEPVPSNNANIAEIGARLARTRLATAEPSRPSLADALPPAAVARPTPTPTPLPAPGRSLIVELHDRLERVLQRLSKPGGGLRGSELHLVWPP